MLSFLPSLFWGWSCSKFLAAALGYHVQLSKISLGVSLFLFGVFWPPRATSHDDENMHLPLKVPQQDPSSLAYSKETHRTRSVLLRLFVCLFVCSCVCVCCFFTMVAGGSSTA